MIRLCLISLHHLFYVMLIYWNPSEGQHETLWMKSLFYFLFFHSFLWGKCDTCWVFDLPSHKNPAGLIHIYASDCFKVHFRFNQPLWRALGMWGLSLRQIQEHIHSAQSYVLTQPRVAAVMTLWAKRSKQLTWNYQKSKRRRFNQTQTELLS